MEAETASAARMQGLLARGDGTLFPLLVKAAAGGSLRRALGDWDGDVAWYLDRERARDEVFPWDVIDVGVARDYLWREWERYRQGLVTAKCPPAGCAVCGRCLPGTPRREGMDEAIFPGAGRRRLACVRPRGVPDRW